MRKMKHCCHWNENRISNWKIRMNMENINQNDNGKKGMVNDKQMSKIVKNANEHWKFKKIKNNK